MNNDFSEEFVNGMRKRVELSFFKYGPARDNFASGRVDALATAEKCLEAFKKDHNSEHLIDAANYLMFRYKYPMPGDFFKATDDNRLTWRKENTNAYSQKEDELGGNRHNDCHPHEHHPDGQGV